MDMFTRVAPFINILIVLLVLKVVEVFYKRLSEISKCLQNIDAKLDRFIVLHKKNSEE